MTRYFLTSVTIEGFRGINNSRGVRELKNSSIAATSAKVCPYHMALCGLTLLLLDLWT